MPVCCCVLRRLGLGLGLVLDPVRLGRIGANGDVHVLDLKPVEELEDGVGPLEVIVHCPTRQYPLTGRPWSNLPIFTRNHESMSPFISFLLALPAS